MPIYDFLYQSNYILYPFTGYAYSFAGDRLWRKNRYIEFRSIRYLVVWFDFPIGLRDIFEFRDFRCNLLNDYELETFEYL